MYDIYKVIPNRHGSLDHLLVAGNYEQWGDVYYAIVALQSMVIKLNIQSLPIFEVQICRHKQSSQYSHYKTAITHTAPTSEEELRNLIGEK